MIAHVLMIYVTWLLFTGSWAQARINWDVEAPVTGLSMAIFYGAGHLSDMEKRLMADFHLNRASESWLTAWQLDKPVAKLGNPTANGK